jgi:hypothetical protein
MRRGSLLLCCVAGPSPGRYLFRVCVSVLGTVRRNECTYSVRSKTVRCEHTTLHAVLSPAGTTIMQKSINTRRALGADGDSGSRRERGGRAARRWRCVTWRERRDAAARGACRLGGAGPGPAPGRARAAGWADPLRSCRPRTYTESFLSLYGHTSHV